MANCIIASPALGDAATLYPAGSATSTAALQTQPLADRWGAGTTPAFEANLGTAKSITLMALLGHNGSATGQWRLRGATSQANLTAAPGYDSGLVSLWPATGKPAEVWDGLPSLMFNAAGFGAFPWWRGDISDAAAPGGNFTAGRLYLCDATTAWQLRVNMARGATLGFDDKGDVTETKSGHLWPGRAVGRPRVLGFAVPAATEDEMLDNEFELQRLRGLRGDILVVMDPAATKHLHRKTIYGLRRRLEPIVLPTFDTYETQFQVKELIP